MSRLSSILNKIDVEIIKRHKEAVAAGLSFYEDPETKLFVMTESHHRKRKKCCGTSCRHCPYEQINVKPPRVKKSFNGYFYK